MLVVIVYPSFSHFPLFPSSKTTTRPSWNICLRLPQSCSSNPKFTIVLTPFYVRDPIVCAIPHSNPKTVASEAELAQLLTSTKPNSLVVLKFCAALNKASKAVEAKFEQTAAQFSECGGEMGVHFAKVDFESNRQLFEKMGIRSVPHVQVCSAAIPTRCASDVLFQQLKYALKICDSFPLDRLAGIVTHFERVLMRSIIVGFGYNRRRLMMSISTHGRPETRLSTHLAQRS